MHLAWIVICENDVRNTAAKKEPVGIFYLDFPKAAEEVSVIGGCEGQAGGLERQGERSSSVVIKGFLRKERS